MHMRWQAYILDSKQTIVVYFHTLQRVRPSNSCNTCSYWNRESYRSRTGPSRKWLGFTHKTQSNTFQMAPSRTLHHLASTKNRAACLGTTGFKGRLLATQVRYTVTWPDDATAQEDGWGWLTLTWPIPPTTAHRASEQSLHQRDCVEDKVVLDVCQPPSQLMEYNTKKYVEELLVTKKMPQMLSILTTLIVMSL